MNIRKNLVSTDKYRLKCPYPMVAEFITVHNTANDASADNEIRYMISNDREVSFHYAIDDKEVVQGLPLNRNGWHAGDGANGDGNRKSIGIEICYSKSGGVRWEFAKTNAIRFIAMLLKERNWGVDRLRQHYDWSRKNCPHRLRAEGWQRFVDAIRKELNGTISTPAPVPPASTPPPAPSPGIYTGSSLVDYLKSIRKPSDFISRSALAKQYGISNYSGTAEQNMRLLNLLRSSTVKPQSPAPKPQQSKPSGYNGASLVDYLKSIKVDSSFANRSRLAARNGIKNYIGTAGQNLRLLKILRGF